MISHSDITPDKSKAKPHLSPSSINMMSNCEAQWNYRYKEGIIKPPGIALLRGKSTDVSISHNMEQKIESHSDLKEDEVVDAFVTEWDTEKDNTVFLPNDNPEEQREGGINSIKHYHSEMAPTIQPETVQEKFEIEFKGFDYNLLGYSDIITDSGIVIDNKTASKSPAYCSCREKGKKQPNAKCKICRGWGYDATKISIGHLLQMTVYDLGYQLTRGKEAKSVRLDYLIKNKTPKIATVEPKITNSERTFLQKIMGITAERATMIYNEKITPTPNRASFMCSHKWCGYADICERDFGGKVKE